MESRRPSPEKVEQSRLPVLLPPVAGWQRRMAVCAHVIPLSFLPQSCHSQLRTHIWAFPLEWGKRTLGDFLGEPGFVTPILGSIFCSKCIDFNHIRVDNLS